MRIGIDLGGTKIEAIALDENGKEVYRHRVPTPQGDYVKTVEEITNLVLGAEKFLGWQNRRASVGVGAPGAISTVTGLIKNSNSICLIGHALDKDLSMKLDRVVRLANDANCFALSEATDGAAQGAGVVFGVILGTGVGGGIVVNGNLINGINSVAGEWGHNFLPWPTADELPGRKCYCGKLGCIETFLSGPGLSQDYFETSGIRIPGFEMVKLAIEGEALPLATLERFENRLAKSLASVINILDPDVIVLGGGLSNIDRLYKTIPDKLKNHVFSDEVNTRLVKAKFGDSSGVRGAAWLH
jgi:fructokinase